MRRFSFIEFSPQNLRFSQVFGDVQFCPVPEKMLGFVRFSPLRRRFVTCFSPVRRLFDFFLTNAIRPSFLSEKVRRNSPQKNSDALLMNVHQEGFCYAVILRRYAATSSPCADRSTLLLCYPAERIKEYLCHCATIHNEIDHHRLSVSAGSACQRNGVVD